MVKDINKKNNNYEVEKEKKAKLKVLKKSFVSLIVFTLFLVLSFSFVNAKPSDDLDTISKFKYWVSHFEPMTIAGQEAGCSVYPDAKREDIYFSSNRYVKPSLLLLSGGSDLSENGKINIYGVNGDGSYNFLKEKDYGEKYQFLENKRYSLEFYNCPDEEEKFNSISECETSDGKTEGEIICKGGSYLAEVNFNLVNGKCEVSYDKVKSCDYGCTYSICNDEGEDLEGSVVETHDEEANVVEVWSDNEANEEYEKVREDLEGKVIELEGLNEALKEQKEQMTDEEQKEEIEEEIKNNQKQQNSLKDDLQNIREDIYKSISDNVYIVGFGIIVLLLLWFLWG